MTDERRIDRMAGCSRLGKGMLVTWVVLLAAFCLLNMDRCFYATDRGSYFVDTRSVIMELKAGLDSYAVDYNRFPVQVDDLRIEDVSTRSRGMLLKVLCREYVPGFTPRGREVIYAQFKMAKNRKFGLWQDGGEWVLSDKWGEPYYIILDTNKDDMVANPEFGAVFSDPKRAEFYQKNPMPQMLPLRIAIYSSGKDRDPKTWDDNVCSWRSR